MSEDDNADEMTPEKDKKLEQRRAGDVLDEVLLLRQRAAILTHLGSLVLHQMVNIDGGRASHAIALTGSVRGRGLRRGARSDSRARRGRQAGT